VYLDSLIFLTPLEKAFVLCPSPMYLYNGASCIMHACLLSHQQPMCFTYTKQLVLVSICMVKSNKHITTWELYPETVGLLWLTYGCQVGGCHQSLKKKNGASSLDKHCWKLAHFNGGRRKLELICL
jgi:hypothetical protein